MSYELFRNDVLSNLISAVPQDLIVPVLNIIDRASAEYDIKRKVVSLTVVNGGIPEPVKMYLAARSTENIKKKTLDVYLCSLRNFFNAIRKPIDQVTANDIRCYLYDYQQRTGVKDRTLEQLRIHINNFYEWCIREDLMQKNPCCKVRHIKYYATPREPFNPIEIETLRACCKDLREKAVVDLLFSTGLRVSELCALCLEDISFKTNEVKVRHGKGDKFRITYLNAEAVVSLQAYLASRSDSCPYVIVNHTGNEKHMIHKKSIENLIRNVCSRAGIDSRRAHPHVFRHTFATVMVRNGAPVQHVQQLLGHAKLETTMVYAQLSQDDIRRTHERCVI